jgi:hypothetical protein
MMWVLRDFLVSVIMYAFLKPLNDDKAKSLQ